MLEILPIKDKILQESICIHWGVKYVPDLMAYAAYKNGNPIGICQFSIKDESAKLVDLINNAADTNSLLLMGHAVLNFIDLCRIRSVKCQNQNIDDSLLYSLGFSKKENGSFEIDLCKPIN